MEFKIAMTDTPTSANTASHILAIPNAPSISTIAFTPSANTIFWCTMESVFLAIFTRDAYLQLDADLAAFNENPTSEEGGN